MNSRSEVSSTDESLAAPPQPVSTSTKTELYILAYMKGISLHWSSSTMRNVEALSRVHEKQVDGAARAAGASGCVVTVVWPGDAMIATVGRMVLL